MLTRVCCVCHKVERDGEWLYAPCLSENALVTHGYCPSCFAEAMAEVEDMLGPLPVGGLGYSDWSTMRGH
jgi:hypothetical protein